MPRRRFYATVEIEADTYGDGPTTFEIVRAVNQYIHNGSKQECDSMYIQNATTLSILDEKGKEI